jgi:FKBP-type peptidyl-prolyl cis-trans isomerase 2
MTTKKGDKVKVEYKGTLDDGTVFDTSEGRAPLEFEVGAGQVIPGFDKAVIGMKKGEKKKVSIKPSEAYGEVDPSLIKKIPKQALPKKIEPKKGMVLALRSPNGRQMPAKIVKVGKDEVTLDLNHSLAGKTLNFEIKVI